MEGKNMKIILDALNNILQILCSVSPLLKKCSLLFTTKIYLKSTLMFDDKQCYISQSVYKTTEHLDFVTRDSMECFQKLQSFLHSYDYQVIPFSESLSAKNVIHLGGPAANINVNSLFVTKYKNFITYTPLENKNRHEKLGLNVSCFKYTNETSEYKRGFKIGNVLLSLDEPGIDYGIFIRIPRCKKDGINHTIHVIFCAWAPATIAAVSFFIDDYKMIAKKFKKSKYCFAIKISRINNHILPIDDHSIIDLTEQFF